MIDITYKKKGLNINAIWFCENLAEALASSRADIVFFHGVSSRGIKNSIVIPQKTMLTDLSQPLENIYSGFGRHCRGGIKKAKQENLKVLIHDSASLTAYPELEASFRSDYDEFVRLSSIENAYNNAAMQKYIEEGVVVLTRAVKDGRLYAQHIYLTCGSQARLLYSVSNFRNEGIDKNLTGNANRLLHWKDMQCLKERGVVSYDWGGIANEEKPTGVDKFKLKFHGRVCTYYNVIIGKTAKGKAVVYLLKCAKKLFYRNKSQGHGKKEHLLPEITKNVLKY